MKQKYSAMLAGVAAVIATAGAIAEYSTETAQAATGMKLFRAEGTHTCWSSQNIGYSCFVSGVGFFDAGHATWKLKQVNCCKNALINGVRQTDGQSTGFKLTLCTWWH